MRVAIIQMNSQNDIGANLEAADVLLQNAARQKADYALLPENFAFMGSESEKIAKSKAISAEALAFLERAAKQHQLTITGGGMPMPAESGKFFNSAITVTPDGKIFHRYDKLHLFDAQPGDKISYQESRSTEPGRIELALFQLGGFSFGMSICYDLRFPALYRTYAHQGAHVLCVPAAFTHLTGSAHWHSLLRCRAIENTCYAIAAAQCGEHPAGRETFGHSIAIDPWGQILAELQELPGVAVVELELNRVEEVRRRLPSLLHDRL